MLEGIHALLEHVGFTAAKTADGAADVALYASAAPGGVRIPAGARTLVEQGPIRVQSSGGALYVSCDGHVSRVDLASGAAEVGVPQPPTLPRKDVLLLVVFLLLRRRGLYGLHASGVVRGGTGCLFVAPSGSGKSTQTYSLVRQGWEYLGDDSLLLRDGGDHVQALALRRHLCLDPALARPFPETARHGKASQFARRGKHELSMRALYPRQIVDGCVPRMLIFPEIVAAPVSRLVPMEAADALLRLMNESLAMALDPEARPIHLRLLGRLVHQARSWRLLAGRDLHARPEGVARLLEPVCPSPASLPPARAR